MQSGRKKKSASSPSNAYYEKSAHTHTLTNPDSDNKIKFYESEKEIEKKRTYKRSDKTF